MLRCIIFDHLMNKVGIKFETYLLMDYELFVTSYELLFMNYNLHFMNYEPHFMRHILRKGHIAISSSQVC